MLLLAYSGGLHCCWTYYVISVGPQPELLLEFENGRDATIYEDEHSKRLYFEIEDGSFDYFDGLCHACTPFPIVFFQIDGKRLVDISPQFVGDYDDIVKESEAALNAQDLAAVAAMTTIPSESRDPGTRATAGRILAIVFAYLYSNRGAQARGQLQAMWPKFDQERIWNEILKKRREGILRYLNGTPEAEMAPNYKGEPKIHIPQVQ